MTPKTTILSAIALATVSAAGFATLSIADTDTATKAATEASVPSDKQITIWRDPNCGCCDSYADYMEKHGYEVTRIDDRDFDKRSIEVGVPAQGLGCPLSQVDGYSVSGLVPAEIVERLTTERPEITGITLPGMPMNAPGMGGKSGTLKTYAFNGDEITVFSDE